MHQALTDTVLVRMIHPLLRSSVRFVYMRKNTEYQQTSSTFYISPVGVGPPLWIPPS